MAGFREFTSDLEQMEQILLEFNAAQPLPAQQPHKLWSAKKPEIMQMWQNFRNDTPILITPLSDKDAAAAQSSTYGEDGIRITGSWAFVSSMLSRLKELIAYENPQNKLRLVLRATDKGKSRPDGQSFVFYLNLERRKQGKAGRPQVPAQKAVI